ncbi:toxic anion resistance protein [Pseudomonas phage REC]|nr:toxic anion resistance protein [Pseudomonas phage REC]UGL62612.1 tellurite resistance protein [Pseudomonas phage REC1]
MSVLGRAQVLKNAETTYAEPQQVVAMPQAPRQSAFPATIKPAGLPARQLIVSDDDIDRIGESVSRDLGSTTQKIITKMSVGKFDELGAILTVITAEADKLDPASLQKGGVVGWFQNKFSDLKATLTMRLTSAQEVFGDLENKISSHITVQQQWIGDMEGLYNENYNHYGKITAEMREVENLIANCESQIASWPVVDVNSSNAAMEAQMVRDAESKVHRLKLKLDTLLRLKTMTEINSPRIRQQQESSRTAVSTLKGIMLNIPVIMMEFALFKQTLDVNKSITLVTNVRDLTEKSLLKGSEGAKVAAIQSAKALGTAAISTETLSTLRNRVLETVTEVRQIEREDVVRCTTDAKELANGQKSLLTALQQTGSI